LSDHLLKDLGVDRLAHLQMDGNAELDVGRS
jgi:hypothetical protein